MTGPLATPAAVPADWLSRFSQAIGRHIPDAMSTAVGMLLLLAVGALAIGNSGVAVMDAFYRGLWMLLPFTMQMALILVLSSTLGEAPVFRRAISRLSPAAPLQRHDDASRSAWLLAGSRALRPSDTLWPP